MRSAAYLLTATVVSLTPNYNDKSVMIETAQLASPQPKAPAQVIKIPVRIKEEREIQKAVDDGHQPWRLLALDVAYSVLAAHKITVSQKECKLEKEEKVSAVASCNRGRSTYRVLLERLVRTDGIWTAKTIEIFDAD